MATRLVRGCAALLCALLVFVAQGNAQRGRGGALPPLSMTCPHHPDVIESSPGTCPFCKMTLVPARLASAWSCPIHPATISDTAGSCPICKRALVRVTVSMTWSCAGSPTTYNEPGTCAGGAARTLTRALRAHGDHNPRHGGQFFMAPDSWHHVEGVHPSARVFRLYVYDDFARPLPAAELRSVSARLVTSERFDPATRKTTELRSFPLRPSEGSAYLEARIDPATLPSDMTAKIRFKRNEPEHRFDFTFQTLTTAPAAVTAPGAAAATTPAAPPAPAAARPPAATPGGTRAASRPAATPSERPAPPPGPPATATPSATTATAPSSAAVPPTDAPASADAPPTDGAAPTPDPALAQLPIPDDMDAILAQLRVRTAHVRELIDRGESTAVWVPAFQVRDLALALEPHLAHLPSASRDEAAPAMERIVRLAWLLDAQGDTGNRLALSTGYDAFVTAVTDLLTAFGRGAQ